MIHPKHWVELDAIPEKCSRAGSITFLRIATEQVNEDGLPTSILIEIGDDEHAARCVADRLCRVWNMLKEVSDDQLGNMAIVDKAFIRRWCELMPTFTDHNGTPICVDCGNSSELCICQYDGCLWCGEPLEFCDCYELEGDLP